MARTRNIKPGFFKNEQLAELPMAARLLFAGLWTIADRDGCLEDRPKRIKAEVFPYDNQPVDRLLSALDKAGFITRYAVGESRFISIPTWNKHQNPHVKEPASIIPKPGKSGTRTGQEPDSAPDKNSSSRALTLNPSMGSNHGEPVTPIPDDPPPSDAIDPNPSATVSPANGNRQEAEVFHWYLDESFTPFVELYRRSGKPVIDDDFANAWHRWKKLDFEQKLQRVDRLKFNLDNELYDDPAFIPAPWKFIEIEWQRILRKPRKRAQDEGERLNVLVAEMVAKKGIKLTR